VGAEGVDAVVAVQFVAGIGANAAMEDAFGVADEPGPGVLDEDSQQREAGTGVASGQCSLDVRHQASAAEPWHVGVTRQVGGFELLRHSVFSEG
jgi:hypothetical protein